MKKFLVTILCILALCMGLSIDTQAVSDSIKVNGVDILTSNTMPQGVNYDETSNTLTIDSMNLTIDPYNAGMGIEIRKSDINIVLKGSSTIVGYVTSGIGIYCTGNINISGTGDLTIKDCGFMGILADGTLTIQDATVSIMAASGIDVSKMNVKSGQVLVTASSSHAIAAKNGLEISGGDIMVSSTNINTIQINDGTFLQSGGSVEITPNDNTQPIYAYKGIKIHGGKIKLNGNMGRVITLKNGVEVSLKTGVWFSPDDTYKVTVVDGTGSGYYKVGDTVTISAGSDTNTKKFIYWIAESNANINLKDAEENKTTFVMPMNDVTITAYKIEALKKDTYINAESGSYKVINGKFNNPTVAYWGHRQTKKKIKTVTIPDTFTYEFVTYKVVEISSEAFINNKNLKTLKIGNNVSKIGKRAFQNCKSLQNVTFGKKVKTIESKAFYGCKKLKKITFKGTALTKIKSKAFKNTHKNAVVKVPSKKYKNYKKLFKKSSVGFSKNVKIKK